MIRTMVPMRLRAGPATTAVGSVTLAILTFALPDEWRRYGWIVAAGLFVLFVVLLWLDNRRRPELERVERIVRRNGRTEIHWEEHRYGVEIRVPKDVEGAAEITAKASIETQGTAERTLPLGCTYNEGMWWLILETPEDFDIGIFRVKVTDPLGGGATKEFGQAGGRIVVRYPEDFRIDAPSDSAKQPWGRYWVRWDVYRLTDDKEGLERYGAASCEFDWKE